ncbi:MAG TPA: type II secretion system protein [Candidatus Paceibacterota bacterium]|nr:type II secretion system protein [Candidatus Paceibacterota bacterium]
MHTFHSAHSHGFSLLEVVIALAIIGLLVSVVSVPFAKFRRTQALENSTNAVVAVLNDARTKTFGAYDDSAYSVHLDTTVATLFSGTTYAQGAAGNESAPYEYPVTATWSIQGGGSIISFNRLTGTTASYGTITLGLPDGTTRTVTIGALGTITRN